MRLRLAPHYLLIWVAMTAATASACDTSPAPGSDPTPEELTLAMRVAGAATPPRGVFAASSECMPASRLGFYNKRGVIVLEDNWRRVGGLTRLIHELRHHHQHEMGEPLDECDASQVAAHWADDNGYTNDAKRERAYGASACAVGHRIAEK
jgi:hypothetical protein